MPPAAAALIRRVNEGTPPEAIYNFFTSGFSFVIALMSHDFYDTRLIIAQR